MTLQSVDVLIVDDDAGIRALWRTMLKRHGLVCVEAADGLEALEQMEAVNCAVIVLDIVMPRADGHAFIERFSAARRPEQHPVILVFSASGDEEMQRVRPDVAHAIVRKPFDVGELSELVALCARA